MRNKLILGAMLAVLLAVASVSLAFAGNGSGHDDDDAHPAVDDEDASRGRA